MKLLKGKKMPVKFKQDSILDCEDSIPDLIASFNGAKDVGSPAQLKNLLAWWAAEEVCRGICIDWDDEERATA